MRLGEKLETALDMVREAAFLPMYTLGQHVSPNSPSHTLACTLAVASY